jgi:hypothetical protein
VGHGLSDMTLWVIKSNDRPMKFFRRHASTNNFEARPSAGTLNVWLRVPTSYGKVIAGIQIVGLVMSTWLA